MRSAVPEAFDANEIVAFCQRNHIRKLALFGSILRSDFQPDSDVDILVEFDADAHVGWIGMASMENELSQLIGRRVDLRTPAELSRYFREAVVGEAEVIYAGR